MSLSFPDVPAIVDRRLLDLDAVATGDRRLLDLDAVARSSKREISSSGEGLGLLWRSPDL